MNLGMSQHALEYYLHFVAWCSLLSVLLPPVEYFADFPRLQRAYRLLIQLVSRYGALNLRGSIAQWYQKQNGNGLPAPPESTSQGKDTQ